ncbi:hypothetical protein BY458DRAFT_453140 [Sporodiniella umbellata]|nr:hypothetical protein BY458DRAFT_453140 [Sporodiniella umbellata]
MSLRFEIEQWAAACIEFDKKQFESSLRTFIGIAETSKIHFNIGLIFAIVEEHDRAIASYNKAIELDPYLAVAYFQRGVSFFIKNDMMRAELNFSQALEKMRGNDIINYYQLGLQFRLYSCEALFNRGICQLKQGKMDAGLTDLYHAQTAGTTTEHTIIDQAVRDQGRGYSVFSIPPTVLFKPPENKLKQLQGGLFAAAVDQLCLPRRSPQRNNSVLLLNHQDLSKLASLSAPKTHHPRSESGIYLEDVDSKPIGNRSRRSPDSGYSSSLDDRYNSQSSRAFYPYISKEDDEGYGDFDKELEEVYGSFNALSMDHDWLQNKLKEEAQLSKNNSSSTHGKLKIKVHYDDTRMLLVSSTITFDELVKKILEKFNIQDAILLNYKDEESEHVLLIDDEDLDLARQVSRRTNVKNSLEKLELWCVVKQ